MKRIKLLTALTALPILGSSLIPLTSCGGQGGQSTDAISCLTSKTLQIESGKTTDFKFKFEAKPYDSKVTVTIANNSTTQPQVNFIDDTTQEASTTVQITVDGENKFTLHIGFVETQTTTCESKFNLTFSYKKDDTDPTTNFQIQDFSLKFVDPTTILRTVKFTITGGGRMEGDLQTQVQNGKTWADVTKPSPIDSETVTFAGWYNGETEMKDTDVISSDLNITAKFITCTPTSCFNFSTGSGGATLISCNQSEISRYQDIVLPEMVTISGTSYKVNEIAANAFANATTSMKKIVVSKNIKTINASAFSGCTSLNEVSLPDGLTTISDNAFFDCTSMTTITIPASVSSIGANAFGVTTSESGKWTTIHFNEIKFWKNQGNYFAISTPEINAKSIPNLTSTIEKTSLLQPYLAARLSEMNWNDILTRCNWYEENQSLTDLNRTFASLFMNEYYMCCTPDCYTSTNLTGLIGLEKTIKINSQDHIVRIIDINHDILTSDTTKKAALTFEMVTLLSDSNGSLMKSCWDSANNHYYTNSVLRANLTGNGLGTKSFDNTVFSMLPSELQSSIKTVNKKVATYNNITSHYDVLEEGYNDKLFPLTNTEMAQSSTEYIKKEGSAYTYWTNNDSYSKKDVNGNAKEYWLCSPFCRTDSGFDKYAMNVSNEGSIRTYYSLNDCGVSFGFCI